MPYEYASAQQTVPAVAAKKIVVDQIILFTNPDPKEDASPGDKRILVRYKSYDAAGNVVGGITSATFTFGVGLDVDPTDVLITRAAQSDVTALDVYTALQNFVYGQCLAGLALTRAGFPTSGSVT